MPADQPNDRDFERIVPRSPEVLDTDSGRKPIWGIVAGVAFVAFALVVVWHVTSGDPTPTYTSQSAVTVDGDSRATTAAPATATQAHRQSRTAATVFFFGMFGAMALVGARIVWGARRVHRVGT